MEMKKIRHRLTFRLRRLISVFEPFYISHRHRLPTSRLVRCAGFVVARKPLDFLFDVTAQIRSEENYESALVQALRSNVRADDRITIIGGGLGVTAALAGSLSRTVVCYEASKPYARIAAETLKLNGQFNVALVEAVVGVDVGVYGKEKTALVLPPEALQDCDLLEMDCEGAETLILRRMTIQPRVIVVETHGLYGAPTALIAGILEDKGYKVQNLGIAETRYSEFCRTADIMCLVGLRMRKPDRS